MECLETSIAIYFPECPSTPEYTHTHTAGSAGPLHSSCVVYTTQVLSLGRVPVKFIMHDHGAFMDACD